VAAIETRSLTKRYGSLYAVDDVDLRVEGGEVFGFLGSNGAGKSTTISVLLDFVRRTSGEVRVLGHDPEQQPRAVRANTGVLPEAAGFHDRETARRHLRFTVAMRGANDDPDALLERVGIADAADRPVGGFSTGMRQRLGLALGLGLAFGAFLLFDTGFGVWGAVVRPLLGYLATGQFEPVTVGGYDDPTWALLVDRLNPLVAVDTVQTGLYAAAGYDVGPVAVGLRRFDRRQLG
jgi:ABC-type lipopolysaccharide export system ATPase subunit